MWLSDVCPSYFLLEQNSIQAGNTNRHNSMLYKLLQNVYVIDTSCLDGEVDK